MLVIVREITATAERDTTICEGASVQLKAGGGVYYSWQPTNGLSNGSGAIVIAKPQTSTSYSVIAFDGVCFDTAVVNIKVVPRPHLIMPAVPSICANTPIELGVKVTIPGSSDSDVVSYRWSPTTNINDPNIPNPVVTLSKDAWYKVTVTTKYGCVVTDSIHILMQLKLHIAVSADTSVCEGTPARLYAKNAIAYEWSPAQGLNDSTLSNPSFTGTKTTTYRVIGKAGACIDTQHVTVTVYPRPTIGKARGDTTVCTNDRVHLWIEGSDTINNRFTWYPAADFENPSGHSVYLHPTTPRTYTVIVSNASGCTVVDSVRVRVDNALTVTAGPGASACDGESVVLHLTSNNDAQTQFTWTPNDGVWNPTTKEFTVVVHKNQSYKVHGQRGSCTGDAEFSVSVKPQPVFTISNDTALCYGSTVSLAALSTQPGMSYRWLNGTALDTSLDNALSATPTTHPLVKDLHLTVEANLDGCIRTKDVVVRVLSMPSLIPPNDTLICAGEATQLHIETSAIRAVKWEPSEGLSSTTIDDPIASPSKNTVYTVSVVNNDGCVRTATFAIGVKPRVGIHLSMMPIHGGEVLSPGDTTTIYVRVRGDSAIQSPLTFDVVFNSNIFEQTKYPYSDINGRRYVHVSIPSYTFLTSDTTIISIPGKALQAAPAFSNVNIVNIEVDSSRCPNLTSTGSLISIASCFSAGRNVTMINPLALTVFPNPIAGDGSLSITTSERGSCIIVVYDNLGQEVGQWSTTLSSETTVLPLHLNTLGSGVYTVLAKTKEQFAHVRMLKE